MKMNDCHKTRILLITILFLFVFGMQTTCLAKPEPENDKIALDYKDINLTDLIKTISELTGRNFIYDDQIRGKVTIISPESMTKEEAYQLFLSVLSVKGYTLVQSNKANKIVPIKNAKQSNLSTSSRAQGDNYVTQLIRLKHADAQVLATAALSPLIPKTSNLSVYEPTNTLILTDSAANINRLIEIIADLDIPTGLDHLEVFHLDQADAETVAKLANTLFNNKTQTRKTKAAVAAQKGQVIAYQRTNSLLAMASADEITLLRDLIKAIDIPSAQDRSDINVYYLKNADAEDLAKSLNEIMANSKRTAPKQAKNQIEPLAISAVTSTNSLLISASPKEYAQLKKVIEKLDIQRLQVYVEALILELSMDATRELGVSLQGAASIDGQSVILGTSNLNSGSVGLSDFASTEDSGVPNLLAKTVKGLMLGGLFNPITTIAPDGSTVTVPALSALIQLSQTSGDVNILSAPRLLTSDNKEAQIVIGSNVPIITNRLTDTSNPNSQSVSVERQDVALTLRFTPQITEGDLVQLDIFQEITDISSNTVGNVNEVGPTLTKRQLSNTVLAEDGKTVTLGGLIGTSIKKNEFKVPVLGDIPLLGRLFRSNGVTKEKTNLLVFITPKIIHNAKEMEAITRRARATSQAMQTEEMLDEINTNPFMLDVFEDNLREGSATHE